ncbi:MAG: Plug domain-containing protein [Sphingobium sp.]|uniref:Plug domain-containing protein n=1 Tax=Sphingobium sp. TaxID=1912891 RepID=UPI0029BD408F|nr:Plug domain-containing protein [Sphingobium sp.]MDX3911650.1 Plug domain-containing protein [Sphingobium sp.]
MSYRFIAPSRRSQLLSAIAALALLPGLAHAAEDAAAEADGAAADRAREIVVTANSQYDRLKAEVDKIPGSASVVLNAQVERGRASNAEDVLAFVPGVYAQATSGNSANKISIRGSGLNTFYQGYSLGIRYLYDGLPITGPGGTQEDLLNIAGVNHTQILNGSNAFSYGALSLGGAINFVTHTGETSPGLFASAEFGRYPHTASKLMDRHTLDTRMEIYSAAARETVGGVLSVQFDKKLGAWAADGHVYVRDPKGKSGGAIFGMPLLGLNAVQPWAQAKLVGIPTLWQGKEIIGASAAMLIPLLEAVTQGH